jgi:hypothetical protein
MKRKELFKNTKDDWYGNYPNNQIKLKYIGELSDGKFRVACWGNDDFGDEAISTFEILKEYDFINHEDLKFLGFIHV